MKHIYNDRRTRRLLDDWAHNTHPKDIPLCFASFFFWNSGTDMQKSQCGLFRSLLFQILGTYPDIIPIVFPDRWAEEYSGSLSLGQQIIPEPWSLRELSDAFKKIFQQREFPLKLCMLIDGLDEFSGVVNQICILFKEISHIRPETTKLCLSSRPWVEFRDNFQGCASLRLQDLTANDINTYVRDKFHENQAFQELKARDPKPASDVICEIVEKAEGVFLWVQVVVELLLRGVQNKDSIPQLLTRLRFFPRKLYPLYDSILSQIEPMYLEWASKTFQMMKMTLQLSHDPFQKLSRTRTPTAGQQNEEVKDGDDEGTQPLTILRLSIALNEQCGPRQELHMNCEDTQTHLTVRCAGLLEVATSRKSGTCSKNLEVRYMHRTARDFLDQNEKWSKLLADMTPRFSPSFVMMKACILSLGEVECNAPGHATFRARGNRTYVLRIAQETLIYAYHANGDAATRRTRTRLLLTLSNMSLPFVAVGTLSTGDFLQRAAMYCLSDFVDDIISARDERVRPGTSKTLLSLLCSHQRIASPDMPFPSVSMVNTLIKLGGATHRSSFVSSERSVRAWPTVTEAYMAVPTKQMRLDFDLKRIMSFLSSFDDYSWEPKEAPKDPK